MSQKDTEEEIKQIEERINKIVKQNEEINEFDRIKEERRINQELELMNRMKDIAMSDDEELLNQNDINEENKNKKMKLNSMI